MLKRSSHILVVLNIGALKSNICKYIYIVQTQNILGQLKALNNFSVKIFFLFISDYYVPPLEPLVVVASLLVALAAVAGLVLAYFLDRRPRRPEYIVETAQQNLYRPHTGNPTFMEWLAGDSDSYFYQFKDWFHRQRMRMDSRSNSDYEPVAEDDSAVRT